MNRFSQNCFWIVLCDFLNLHAPCCAGHEDGKTDRTVQQQSQVELALDVEPFLNEYALHQPASRASLRRYQSHSQNVTGDIRGFITRAGQLHSAPFAATSRMYLGL